MADIKQPANNSHMLTIDDWFAEHGEQIIYDAAIKAGFDGDSINDWLDRRPTY
jgi:hypothetical protein